MHNAVKISFVLLFVGEGKEIISFSQSTVWLQAMCQQGMQFNRKKPTFLKNIVNWTYFLSHNFDFVLFNLGLNEKQTPPKCMANPYLALHA